jgi:septal ring factor EnvC (AmiA/AmiB activator)
VNADQVFISVKGSEPIDFFALAARVATLEGNVKMGMKQQAETIDGLSKELTKLNRTVATLADSSATALITETDGIKTSLKALRKESTELASRLNSTRAAIGDTNSVVSRLDGRLATTESGLEDALADLVIVSLCHCGAVGWLISCLFVGWPAAGRWLSESKRGHRGYQARCVDVI